MSTTNQGTVVLLHGLARTSRSMSGLRKHLERHGYATWAWTYPSRHMPISELAQLTQERILAEVGTGPIHAVTHSLGGILVRHMSSVCFSRIVMLAPPNQGSLVARRFRHLAIFEWFYGPAGMEVAQAEKLAVDSWPPSETQVGVIAGTRASSLGNPTSWLTTSLRVFQNGEEHDGTVAVEETKLPQMVAFRTVPANHTFIMNDPTVRRWILSFLSGGHFDLVP